MSLDTVTLRRRLQQALGKEFTVGDLLGEGGFAAVFRVREQPLNRDVAVKVIDLGLTPSPSLAVRFVREARSEEHTSELQSLAYLVCRLLLEKKKTKHCRTQKHRERPTSGLRRDTC